MKNFGYLITTKHSASNKLKIVWYWIKINLKFFLFSKFFNLKKEIIFGYHIRAFDYKVIRFLYEEIFFRNEYFFNTKNRKPVIFDCGANIGFATIYLKWLYPLSTIYAFEPDPITFELLKKNIEANKLKGVFLFNFAITNNDGKIKFFRDSETLGSLTMSTRSERGCKDEIIIPCLSLSSFIRKNKIDIIDFIKMDIEGSEKEVIIDLINNNYLSKVRRLNVEYHHKIKGSDSELGEFLKLFEVNNFEYQIDAQCFPISSEHRFQDILLHFYSRK